MSSGGSWGQRGGEASRPGTERHGLLLIHAQHSPAQPDPTTPTAGSGYTTPPSPATPATVRHTSALPPKRKTINHLCNTPRKKGVRVNWLFGAAEQASRSRCERGLFHVCHALHHQKTGAGVFHVGRRRIWGSGGVGGGGRKESECVFLTNKLFHTKLID